MDQHSQDFFGQKSGLIVSTDAKENPYLFLTCIKKKANGDWEKYSEGKKVKLSLLEIVAISDILNKKRKLWSTFHLYKEEKTPISFTWDEKAEDLLWINVDEYSRPLNYPETELLRLLILHILQEKIECATIRKEPTESEKAEIKESTQVKLEEDTELHQKSIAAKKKSTKKTSILPETSETGKERNKTKDSEEETMAVMGIIKIITDKAILIALENNDEIWVPKSSFVGEFNLHSSNLQQFTLKKWILEKRGRA
jgi:hypothetical protein